MVKISSIIIKLPYIKMTTKMKLLKRMISHKLQAKFANYLTRNDLEIIFQSDLR